MKKYYRLMIFAAFLSSLGGCFSAPHKPDEASVVQAPYQGPLAKIAVNDFELKTSGLDAQVSSALKEYFVSLLENTRRFSIVAPQDADLIISIGIVEFVPENSGGKSGSAGGGSSASGFMGGLLGEVQNKANMQLNLRIIDRQSSVVISNKDIQSQVVEHPGKKTRFHQDRLFKEGLSDYAGTPMGKVIHDCLVEAGHFTVENVPQKYYLAENPAAGNKLPSAGRK